jgi:hypothetical protein
MMRRFSGSANLQVLVDGFEMAPHRVIRLEVADEVGVHLDPVHADK